MIVHHNINDFSDMIKTSNHNIGNYTNASCHLGEASHIRSLCATHSRYIRTRGGEGGKILMERIR